MPKNGQLLILLSLTAAVSGGPRAGIISTVIIVGFPQHGQIFGSKGLTFRMSTKQTVIVPSCSLIEGMNTFLPLELKIP